MKILLLALQYPFAIASYFTKALQKRQDVELTVAGPDYGTWIPWRGGMNLKPEYAPQVDIPLQQYIRQPCRINPAVLSSRWNNNPPDLIINIDAGCYLTSHPGIPYFVVATDAHCLNYDLQRKVADRFYNMHKRYSKPGDLYLPYAYSPDYHFPEEVEKLYDVCMIGLAYPQRKKLDFLLRRNSLTSYLNNGEVYHEYRRKYSSAYIGLNWASKDDLNARHFELLAMGIPSVQYQTTDADMFFRAGTDYAPFKTVDEAVAQVKALRNDPARMKEMAAEGLKTVKPHTYDARINTLIEEFKCL